MCVVSLYDRYVSAPKLCRKAKLDSRVKLLEEGASSFVDRMISNTHVAAVIHHQIGYYAYTYS
jgi:hypothetical protein